MNQNQERAKSLLVHYFRLLAKKSGVYWDSDNDSEVGDIVDFIISATLQESRESLKLQQKEPK